MPDLNLAGVDGWSVASGSSFQAMPDPGKPAPMEYQLSGSPDLGGVDPANPVPPAPNLAGVAGFPTPQELADGPGEGSIYNPSSDYGMPDMCMPSLQLANVADDGISFEPRAEFDADPALPDLSEYAKPYGLDIRNLPGEGSGLFAHDPLLDDLLDYDMPNGVQVKRNPLDADPALPDLQQPQLSQDVTMDARPADLAPDALDTMHQAPQYQQLDGKTYPSVYMDQSGMNNRRSREFTLMMKGLDAEERGRS
jgi:hypothetical protein